MEIVVILILSAVAAAAILHPIIRNRARRAGGAVVDVDAEVDRYRRALRAGAVCDACLHANPEDSRFCAECGEPLGPAAHAGADDEDEQA